MPYRLQDQDRARTALPPRRAAARRRPAPGWKQTQAAAAQRRPIRTGARAQPRTRTEAAPPAPRIQVRAQGRLRTSAVVPTERLRREARPTRTREARLARAKPSAGGQPRGRGGAGLLTPL